MNTPYLDYLNQTMKFMEYPQKTIDFVIDTYKKICNNKKAGTMFYDALNLYEKQLMPSWDWALGSTERVANTVGEHVFVVNFVFTLCVSKHVKAFYEQKGMPEGCFYGFLYDIKVKWSECVTVHKMDGISVAQWYNRFVDGTRHTFGRLQFEPMFIWANFKCEGFNVSDGDLIINIHIPGGSKLLKQDCIDSFLKAAEFYAPLFEDGKVVFHCHSWLLFPGHKEFLPETSSLLMFADFFNIVETDNRRGDLWRIFGREDCEDAATLPENTGLQRAYKKRLLEKGEIGGARGFFLVKGNKFIK